MGSRPSYRDWGTRPAIGTVLVVVIVIVIVVSAAGAFIYVTYGLAPGTTQSTSSTGSQSSSSTSSQSFTATTTSISYATSTATTGVTHYKGTFNGTVPSGPFGISDSSGKPIEWNSTQAFSGSFTFDIVSSTYDGTGSGQGNITVSTRGYCTGSTTVSYTFSVTAFHLPGENYQIDFEPPTPANVTALLTCQGSTQGFNTANNPTTYLAVYPNQVTPASIPADITSPLTNGFSYTIIITQES